MRTQLTVRGELSTMWRMPEYQLWSSKLGLLELHQDLRLANGPADEELRLITEVNFESIFETEAELRCGTNGGTVSAGCIMMTKSTRGGMSELLSKTGALSCI